MANELEHFSVLDDESSTSYFLNWANNFGGRSKLRGGDSVVSNTSFDAHVEVEDVSAIRPTGVTSEAAPPTNHEISKAESKTYPSQDTIERSTPSTLPTPTVAPPQAQALPGGVPTIPEPIKDTKFSELGPPSDSPVTNIAHCNPTYISQCPVLTPAAVNKLDEEPATKKPRTPTQQRLLERLRPIVQKVQPTKTVPLASQSEIETAGAEQSENAGGTRVENVDVLSVMPMVDARPGHRYNTMDVYDAMERQYFSPHASMDLNSAADGFRSRVEDVEDNNFNDALPTSGADLADLPSNDEARSAILRSSMDLTPVLKALEARLNAPPTIKTTTMSHARDTTAKRESGDIVPALPYEQAAEDSSTPVAPLEQSSMKRTSSLTATPTEEVEVLEKSRSEARTVMFENLPDHADHTMVQSLIYGAVIERIELLSGGNTAEVKLTNAEDCQRYIDSYPAGIKVKGNRGQQTVRVDKSAKPDTVDNRLQAYLECGATRVVKVEDADEEMTMKALYKFAEGPSEIREVESIVDSCRRGIRSIIFRFTSIYDAVAFRTVLLRDQNWRSKNPHFTEDSCEHATGPRSE